MWHTLNGLKCEVNKNSLCFSGHIFSDQGIRADPDKISAIVNLTSPKDVSELISFLGMAEYYARYLPHYATLTSALRQLLRKDQPFTWEEHCQQAFSMIKQELATNRQLAYFNPQ
ncbi:uncharacterized protein [Ambystoma mexicanum]|uniref:uncharacterized protein n=1 Tax=Ambystoma mexicanum TaxID=8296 RepID=UPI0037E74665